jgi:hypothetical protein
MDKNDWYFIVSAVLGTLALLGMDWKLVLGRVSMPHSQLREVLVLVAVVGSLAMSGVGWYRVSHYDPLHFQSLKKEIVYGKSFRNEKVEIDGKSFQKCTFTNVTFVFHGLAPFDCINCQIDGSRWVESDSDSVAGAWMLIKFMDFMKPDAPLLKNDAGGNPTPIPDTPYH